MEFIENGQLVNKCCNIAINAVSNNVHRNETLVALYLTILKVMKGNQKGVLFSL